MKKKFKAYICGTAFDHELGETKVETYHSIRSLKDDLGPEHVEQCGIVEVEIRFKRDVKKGDLDAAIHRAVGPLQQAKEIMRKKISKKAKIVEDRPRQVATLKLPPWPRIRRKTRCGT